MPELDILHGFEFLVKRIIGEYTKQHGKPFEAALLICPQSWALGSDERAHQTCSVGKSPWFDYQDALEPCPPDYVVSPHDKQRSAGEPWERYLKPLIPGKLFVKTRGKEMLFAAGCHCLRTQYAQQGNMHVVPTSSFNRMMSQSVPGPNQNPEVAEFMRSFVVPTELTVPNARADKDIQTMAVMAAIVGEEQTFVLVDHTRLLRLHIMSLSRPWTAEDIERTSPLWKSLWSSNHGPDWIYETEEAESTLDVWRASVLSHKPKAKLTKPANYLTMYQFLEKVKDKAKTTDEATPKPKPEVMDPFENQKLTDACRSSGTILDAMTSIQAVFNGYGQHTANDLLHSIGLWPGMPPATLCRNKPLYAEFKAALSSYASQYISKEYRERCLSIPNRHASLAYNHKSDANYINQFVQVYRKIRVRMPADLYNKFARKGLFNPEHIIGQPYQVLPKELIHVRYTDVDVFSYKCGNSRGYSVIRAKRPDQWPGSGLLPNIPSDVRTAGFLTTVGPASFLSYKDNQLDPNLVQVKRGPKPRVCYDNAVLKLSSLQPTGYK
ncbi:hypothetical protein C8Q79DRAFT_1039139 [Trametes meyenii]|nr:hypothetical protein C8Q79DRAFT_1039139 [Trametes meyenii]